MQQLKEIFSRNGISVVLQGPGPFFSLFFSDSPITTYRDTFRLNQDLHRKFWMEMLSEGVRILPSVRGLWYLSTAHTRVEIEATLAAASRIASKLSAEALKSSNIRGPSALIGSAKLSRLRILSLTRKGLRTGNQQPHAA